MPIYKPTCNCFSWKKYL